MTVLFQSIFAWAMTFGCMGLFRALIRRENRTIRYISDSSYWLYLAHLALIVAGQMLVRDWPMPALVKLSLVFVFATGVLLVMYQLMVRYTWVGTMLNGKRFRPSIATPGDEG